MKKTVTINGVILVLPDGVNSISNYRMNVGLRTVWFKLESDRDAWINFISCAIDGFTKGESE